METNKSEEKPKRVIKAPVNQKSVYHSFAMLYEMLMNGEASRSDVDTAVKTLNGMNAAYMGELKRTDLAMRAGKEFEIRPIELKALGTSLDSNVKQLPGYEPVTFGNDPE